MVRTLTPTHGLGLLAALMLTIAHASATASALTCENLGNDQARCLTTAFGYTPIDLGDGADSWNVHPTGQDIRQTEIGTHMVATAIPLFGSGRIGADSFSAGAPDGSVWDLSAEQVTFSFTAHNRHYDEFIGFALGVDPNNADAPYLLYDWRRNTSNPARRGSRLALVTGDDVNFFSHSGDDITRLGRGNSYAALAWDEMRRHDVTIDFDADGLDIAIRMAGALIDGHEFRVDYADLPVDLTGGYLAFYTNDQVNVSFTPPEVTAAIAAVTPAAGGNNGTAGGESVSTPATLLLIGGGLLLIVGSLNRYRNRR